MDLNKWRMEASVDQDITTQFIYVAFIQPKLPSYWSFITNDENGLHIAIKTPSLEELYPQKTEAGNSYLYEFYSQNWNNI